MMAHRVGNAAQDKASLPGHALVANHHEVGALLFGHNENCLRARGAHDMHLDIDTGDTQGLGLGLELCFQSSQRVRCHGNRDSERSIAGDTDLAAAMHEMNLGPAQGGQLPCLVDRNLCGRRTITAHNNRRVHAPPLRSFRN